jgi:hypothetical protein
VRLRRVELDRAARDKRGRQVEARRNPLDQPNLSSLENPPLQAQD